MTPLLTAATATPAQARRRILSRPHGAYNDADVQAICQAYAATCAAGGLDLAMVVAQLIHETGNLSSWWAARPRRNPAGIGVTGRSISREMMAAYPERYPDRAWAWGADGQRHEGVSFLSWAARAVPAHVGRLLAYALAPGQGTAAQQQLIDQAMQVRPLPHAFRGVAAATGWQALNGRWAVPGADYDQRIARIAETIRRA